MTHAKSLFTTPLHPRSAGLFAIVFAALLILIQLPISQKNALNSWRNYTDHMLIQLQSSLNNHFLLNRSEEMATELAELGSYPTLNGLPLSTRNYSPCPQRA